MTSAVYRRKRQTGQVPYYDKLSIWAEWRNWQPQQTQNLPGFTPRVGSSPTSATKFSPCYRGKSGHVRWHSWHSELGWQSEICNLQSRLSASTSDPHFRHHLNS